MMTSAFAEMFNDCIDHLACRNQQLMPYAQAHPDVAMGVFTFLIGGPIDMGIEVVGAAVGLGVRASSEIAEMTGTLRFTASQKGNFGIGSGSSTYSDMLGKAWVGDDASLSSDGTALQSQDGLRQYRFPSFKDRLGYTQSNFEWRTRNSGPWTGNGHMNIND